MRVPGWLEALAQDVRFAVRGLHLAPGPFLIAIFATALGIGGTTAVFSVVDRILFRPLPYADQDRLVWFGMKAPISPNEFLLEGDYLGFQQHQTVLESITSMSRVGDCDLNEAEPVRLTCASVAANFLPVLGMRPIIGRNFLPEEEVPNSPRAALLSHGFWQRRFGGERSVVGRRIVIDGHPTEIAGVLPEDFELPNLARADVLLTQQLVLGPRVSLSFLTVFGRLKPGISVQQARASFEPLFRAALERVPQGFRKEVTFHVTSLRERQVRDFRTSSLVLLGCVVALLLIACANVANLLLARATARQHEFAVRSAVGASRGRLVRQVLTESVLLASIGGVAGIAVAAALLRFLVSLAPQGMVRLAAAPLDLRVLVFTGAVSVFSGLLFGLVPALQARRTGHLTATRTTGGNWAASHALLAVQIGLSFVLLTGAGLLMQSLWNLNRIPLGMSPDHVLTIRAQLGRRYSTTALQSLFLEQAFDRLQRLPGARFVALTDTVPLYGPTATMIYSNIEVQGRAPMDPGRQTGGMTVYRWVTPGYFSVLGIPIVKGRTFIESDRLARVDYVIIDERMANRLFPNQDPVGQQIRTGLQGPWRTILGVARAAKNAGISGSDDPEYYCLWRRTPEHGRGRAHFLIRSDAEPTELASYVRAQFAQLDPSLPLTITTMEDNLDRHVQRPRFQTVLFSAFAGIGLLLAAVGQFGLISYLVNRRSVEIGLRMALGATGRNVVSLVLGRTMLWTAAGAAAGALAALALGSQLQPLLFGVKAADAAVYVAVLMVLLVISAGAAWIPSLRAVRIDPASTLRRE